MRVDPDGTATLAGRAAPDSNVQVIVNSDSAAEEKADRSGQFFMLFDVDPDQGPLEMVLSMETPNGDRIQSEQVVMIVVPRVEDLQAILEPIFPEPVNLSEKSADSPNKAVDPNEVSPAVFLASEDRVKILQPLIPNSLSRDKKTLLVEVVSYDERGEAVLSGRGTSGNSVSICVNGREVKTATIANDGSWKRILSRLKPGDTR